jgi:hypothetical protein
MNKRIRELINEHGRDSSGKWVSVDNVELIAELIVLECANVVEKNLFQGIGWNTSRAIKRHFGIDIEDN